VLYYKVLRRELFMKKPKLRIGIIGGNRCSAEIAKLAQAVGREIAQMEAVLICGGLRGVMEAACKGAKEAEGLTVGILPGDEASTANPYIDVPIVTGMGYARNVIVVRSSDIVIAIDGHYGTLSEIAHALSLNIPVIGLKTWGIRGVIKVNSLDECLEKVREIWSTQRKT